MKYSERIKKEDKFKKIRDYFIDLFPYNKKKLNKVQKIMLYKNVYKIYFIRKKFVCYI